MFLLLVTSLAILFANVFVITEHNNTFEATDYFSNSSYSKYEPQSNETMTNGIFETASNLTKMFNNGTLNATNLPNITNGTDVQNETETTDNNNIFQSLSALKQLITKTYWEQRINDPYYLSEAFVPFCAGILVTWLLILVLCTLKCCCVKKNKRNKLLRIKTIKNDTKKDGSQWMLLEKNSSDEEI